MFIAVWWFLVFGWLAPLGWLWFRNVSPTHQRILLIPALSYVWIVIGMIWPMAWGPYYSDLRGSVILLNLVACFAAGSWFTWRTPAKAPALLLLLWMLLSWLLIFAVQYAV